MMPQDVMEVQPVGGSSRTILGHPPGLFLLFLVEMWERFSYYGMRGLLVLYLVTVVAVHQLKPGVYDNTLEITEARSVEGTAAAPDVVQRRLFRVVVGDATGEAAPPVSDVNASLRLQRGTFSQVGDDRETRTWVPDAASDAPDVIEVRGSRGDRNFENSEVSFAVLNPTDAPVKVRVAMVRDSADPERTPTYFTVNDNPGVVSATVQPDSQRTAGENPYVVTIRTNTHESGRNWVSSNAAGLYGWYTGLAYLFPILGGIIADKLIGTHRSMLVGAVLISIGHIVLGFSGMGDLAFSTSGMSLFVLGLAIIVLGTGHFKPTVSVMVGQLYRPGDPRRDGAFTIFYMGINLGAFLSAFVCGTLGEKVGWHWGFGSAAVGMMLGLGLYLIGRPKFLAGIGEAPLPAGKATGTAVAFLVGALALASLFAFLHYSGAIAGLGRGMSAIAEHKTLRIVVPVALVTGVLGWIIWFVSKNRPEDRGPVVSIFVFMFFNAFFWLAFEQAGSSINLFTDQNTDRFLFGWEVPATWFQSINAGIIFMLAPVFAAMWTGLGRKRRNPSQPVKIALGLIFLGLGFLFMVWAGSNAAGGAAKAGMWLIVATYFWHIVGELFLSPTGLSYVTKAAPIRFVSLLMGIWFVSSFIANLGGGLVAAQVEAIEQGKIKLPWSFGGQADFFFLFVVTSIGAGLVILALTPLLKKLIGNREESTSAPS